MFQPLELWIGLRYTRAKRRNHFISFITFISVLGIALGITALITVLSVMNGFEQEIRARILGMAAHATVSSIGEPISEWRKLAALTRQHPEVIGAAPYVQAEAMLNYGKQVSGAAIRGVLPEVEPEVSEVADKMKVGRLDDLKPGGFGIVLGSELATLLGVTHGDKLTVVTPQATVTPAGILPRVKRFTVVGVFEVGMYEYDRGVALMHIEDASKLFQLDGGVNGVRLKLADLYQAPALARQLAAEFPDGLLVNDWTRLHANYFAAVQQEKRVMFIILTLIIAVGVFNIVSTLVMLVTDKEADIAILRTLGATPTSVMGVFFVQGTLIGLFGTLLGLAGGVALALNVETLVPAIERAFDVQFLSPDVYYISRFPSDLHGADVVKTGIVAFLLSMLATLYPAWRAARVQPAQALRYE
jgi:lipoprotein-releasing system permease protein